MKKKILALCLVVVLAITAVTGATLAYFTDTDAQENVFVTGNVQIDLFEDFGNDNDGLEKLVPTTGKVEGKWTNAIEKEVYVENTGSEKAYVRVHIAIPQILDNGDPDFDAAQNVLHFNYDPETIEDGKWNWSKTVDDTTGSNWNFYTAQIDENTEDKEAGIWYNVYVVTYETALENGDVTIDAMSQVYLDSKVTNEDITKIKETLGNQWKIYVVAEAGQADGFEDAYTALNTQFGTPGTYTVNFTADAEQKLYVEGEDTRLTSDELTKSMSVKDAMAGATVNYNGNTAIIDVPEISVKKTKNPAGQEAYWVGYLEFTKPSYATDAAVFTRDGVVRTWTECKDTSTTMQAWVAASESDKDAYMTYTFDWDGDGIFEAVYQLNIPKINLVKPAVTE